MYRSTEMYMFHESAKNKKNSYYNNNSINVTNNLQMIKNIHNLHESKYMYAPVFLAHNYLLKKRLIINSLYFFGYNCIHAATRWKLPTYLHMCFFFLHQLQCLVPVVSVPMTGHADGSGSALLWKWKPWCQWINHEGGPTQTNFDMQH